MNVYTPTKLAGLLLGPIGFLLIIGLMPEAELAYAPRVVLAVTVWTAVWWITEAVPIPAASLMPIILLPTLGGLDMETTAKAYGDPIVFMYMGGFIIAIAIEKWNLHKRMALHILKRIGAESHRIVLGVMLSTAFLSMWISNAATALMMLPVALAIIKEVQEKEILKGDSLQKFSKSILLAVAYAASIGGLATLVGSVPNAVFAAMSRQMLHREIMFFEWFLFGFPVSVLFLIILYFYLTKVQFKVSRFSGKKPGFIDQDLKALGAMTKEEKSVFSVFLATAFLWMFKFLFPFQLSDTSIAILGAVLLFLIPSARGERILEWKDMQTLPWGLLLLFGGGLSLASAFSATNLTAWISDKLKLLDGHPYLFVLIVLTAAILFMTEIMSNTAVANMVIPMTVGLGAALQVEPYGLMAAAALASSCAFMLPISTPPNAAVFGANVLQLKDMIRAGFWLNIAGVLIIVISVYFWLPAILQ
ncbi:MULTISPECIES: SLC13 family permease [Bacillus]|uniref:SLC13 family permease n=1 Tax=Bacillus TaxID=1386 RepID=UPI002242FE92|nr:MULTISPECIES: DASS family sodium-coupled anion symporter [Bacillus]MDN5388460.1 DASS family sodium-coupled anion symporter [Bacillus sp. LB7]MEC1023178.1 DASS family sodium-coupled anion symporter [Bacillus paralicheniformis]MEC1025744.1 DASS family sodium-coupled anion symporter [Bacillus paralicheniformis]MEC1035840.1 DASS family sodium-coupled anion symporter [Bacillus paralicheniformis]MEC1050022.1 DASS family sodium-coupled anion symporter [Bacillus paralicheniformis]